jgi:hypothetical protein
VTRTLEFWPDYGGALLWDADGRGVALESLPVESPLREAAIRWLSQYDDSRLPWEPTADHEWLGEGRRLLEDLRRALRSHGIEIEPHEDFWEAELDSR